MSRILAVEWDNREVRLISGTPGSHVTIEHALRLPIPNAGPDIPMVASVVSPLLSELAKKAGVSGGDAIVLLGRGQVELRNMSLPSGDANDLPDMVRFSALRQFANVGDTWPIDFISLPNVPRSDAGSESAATNDVIAVACSPSTISQIRKILSEAGLVLKQVALRPLAASTLALSSSKLNVGPSDSVLLIDLLSEEAEMVVVEKGQTTFVRTVRINPSVDGANVALSTPEIRRTIIAAMNARPNLKVERIIVWGNVSHFEKSVEDWQAGLNLPVEVIDPLSAVDTKKHVEHDVETGRYAPLIGSLYQYRANPKSAIAYTAVDLLSPRHREEKKKPIRQYALAGTAAVLILGGGIWWYRSLHRKLDDQIKDLTAQLNEMDPNLKLAQKYSQDWKKVENYLKGDIQWLDELAYLSDHALPADKVIFRDTSIALIPISNQGKITAKIDIVDQQIHPEIEENLRDANHQVGSKEIRPGNDRNSSHGWSADPEITISPASVIDPLLAPNPKKPVEADKTGENSSPPIATSDAKPNDANGANVDSAVDKASTKEPASTSPKDDAVEKSGSSESGSAGAAATEPPTTSGEGGKS